MSGLKIEIDCSCGAKHLIPLDESGHYSGPMPCDASQHAELQIQPDEWRKIVSAHQADQVH